MTWNVDMVLCILFSDFYSDEITAATLADISCQSLYSGDTEKQITPILLSKCHDLL